MKTTAFAVAAASLLTIASAQPHRRRNVHQHQHAKKDDVVYTVVDTVYAEATEVPEVIVYVDQSGNPLSTADNGMVQVTDAEVWSTAYGTTPTPSTTSTPTPTPSTSSSSSSAAAVNNVNVAAVVSSSSSSSTSVYVAPTTSSTPVPTTTSVAPTTTSAPATTSSTSSSAAASSSASSGSTGFGIVYSPYKADGTCKTQDDVNSDFKSIGSGYSLVRTYGTDCNQVSTVLSAAKTYGMKMMAGIFDISDVASQVATIVSAVNGDWSTIDTVNVGNELVNAGTASAATVVAAIGTARTALKAAGFTGSVVTVDTLVAARNNPSLCDSSDYCAVNCHPFFDGGVEASGSGDFLTTQIPTLQAVLSNKSQRVMITETGWPWKGETNGKAVPSLDNQSAAIASIKKAFASSPSDVIIFTAFNDMWKSNTAAQFGAEQYWGLGGAIAPSG